MGFSCGIVGLPNVGKSCLFNALTRSQQAAAGNYAFVTIEPNRGRIAVPDERLAALAACAGSATVTPARLEFVDIAGLVRGASRGEGLGNRFLAHIREVDAIAHVLRCFDGDAPDEAAPPDPLGDAETVETELMLADLESLERRLEPLAKKARGGDAEAIRMRALVERAAALLAAGRPARELDAEGDDRRLFPQMQLLSAKPIFYVCNVDDASTTGGNARSARVAAWAERIGAPVVLVSAAVEADIAALEDDAERAEFQAALGLSESGLGRVIRAGYALLDLITFFTAGPAETRAWTVHAGTRAQDAAGRIHSDFARGFIAAETVSYADFVACGGERQARDAARMRREGRDYIVRDGDVILFRFNV